MYGKNQKTKGKMKNKRKSFCVPQVDCHTSSAKALSSFIAYSQYDSFDERGGFVCLLLPFIDKLTSK